MQFLDLAAQSCRIHAGGDQKLPGLQSCDTKLGSHSIQTARGSILPVIIGPKGICHYVSGNKLFMLLRLIAIVDVLCNKADVVGWIRPATPKAISAPLMLTIPL